MNFIEINCIKLSLFFDLNVKNQVDEEELQKMIILVLFIVDFIENVFKYIDFFRVNVFIVIGFKLNDGIFEMEVWNIFFVCDQFLKFYSGQGFFILKSWLDIIYGNSYEFKLKQEFEIFIVYF